jgi:hypothetical protein
MKTKSILQRGARTDCRGVELLLTCLVSQKLQQLEIVDSDSRIDFYTQIFCSTHFCINISKHKSLYLQINFTESILSKSIFLTAELNIQLQTYQTQLYTYRINYNTTKRETKLCLNGDHKLNIQV